MNKIIRYQIISEPDKAKFDEAVKKSIAKGFEPLGGVATTLVKAKLVFSQAMGSESSGESGHDVSRVPKAEHGTDRTALM